MRSATDLQNSIQASTNGITLAELLAQHPGIAKRTAQRLIAKLIESELVYAQGAGKSRRYFVARTKSNVDVLTDSNDIFPDFIPLFADCQDIQTYIEHAPIARKPVGYQRDFLDSYRPNETWYISESLRHQLHKMGKTADVNEPAGTYSRTILNRLLIDLS